MPDLRIAQSYGDSSNIDGFPGVAGNGAGLSLADLNASIGAYLLANGYSNTATQAGGGGGSGGYGTAVNLSSVPATTLYVGDIPASGSNSVASRDDHVHGMPAFGTVYPQLLPGLAPTDGVSQDLARSDHSHGTPVGAAFGPVVAEQTFGGASTNGSSTAAARADHQHGNPTDTPLVHLAGNETITGAKTFNAAIGTTFATNITAPNIIYSVGASTGLSSTGGQNPVLTNTGVLSNVAGKGIAVSSATGNVTITNQGITSLTAGPGISISTGQDPTISNTGVLSLAVTNNATASGSTGNITITNSLTPTYTTVTVNGPGTAFQVLNAASIGTTLTVTGAVTLNSTLSVVGTSTLAALNAQATTVTTLTASGNTAVTGASTFTVGTGATSLGGTLTVAGATVINNTLSAQATTVTGLTVNGGSMLNGNTNISAAYTLTVGSGATTLGGTLNVTGTTTLGTTNAQATTTTTFTANGIVTLNGNTTIPGVNTFTVGSGASTLGGSLTVTGITQLNSTLGVAGATTINNTLSAKATTVTTLHATDVTTLDGNTSVTGSATFTVGVGATNLGGTLMVSAAATMNSTLHVLGTTTLDSNTSVTGAATFTVGTGATNLGGTLTVTAAVTNNSTTTLNGNTSVTGTNTFSTANGTATFGGSTITNGSFTANGVSTFNANVQITGTNSFTVGQGASTLGGSLTVNGQSTFNDNVQITGAKSFTVGTGNSTMGGLLDVSGPVTHRSTFHQIGAATLDATLSVGGDSFFLGNGTLTSFGRTFTVGDIIVTRTFTGNVIKSNNIIDGQVQANDLLTYPGFVEDGSFEERTPATTTWTMTATNATLGSWSITSDPATNVNAYNGSYYATHLGQTGVGATGTDELINNALFPVVGGTVYFAQCQGKSSVGTNGTTSLTIYFYDNTGARLNGTITAPAVLVNGTNTYLPLYTTVVAPTGAVHGRIVGTVTGKTVGQVYLDAFTGGPGVVIPNLSIDASQKLIDNTLSLKTFATNAVPDPQGARRVFAPGSISAINQTTTNYNNLCEDPGFEQFPTTASTTWDVIYTDISETQPDTQYQILIDQGHAQLGQAYLLHNPTLITNTGGSGVIAHAHNNLKAGCKYGDRFYGETNIAALTSPPTGATGTNPTNLPANGNVGFGWNYRDSQGQPSFVYQPCVTAAPTTTAIYTKYNGTSTAPFSAVAVHFDCAISGHTQGFWIWDNCIMSQQVTSAAQAGTISPHSIDGSLIVTTSFDIPSSSVTINSGNLSVGAAGITSLGPTTLNGTLGVQGVAQFSSNINARNAVLGDTGYGGNYFGIRNSGIASPDSYSLLTDSTGSTFLNAATGQPIHFRIQNAAVGNWTTSGLRIGDDTAATFALDVAGTGRFTGNLTAPNVVYSVSASGNLASSGGQTPAITMTATPTFTSATIPTMSGNVQFSGTVGVTGATTLSNTLKVGNTITVQNGTGAYVQLQPGTGTNSGYIEFWPANGSRQGYIGYSSSAATQDSGTIPYVAGIHAFTGTLNTTSTLSENGARVYNANNANLATTAPTTVGFAGTSTQGTGTTYARADHFHAGPATPVTSLAGRTGAVTLTAADIGTGTFPGAVTFNSTVAVTGQISLNGSATATTAPAAGAAAALPATPTGYVTIQINGVNRQLAYY